MKNYILFIAAALFIICGKNSDNTPVSFYDFSVEESVKPVRPGIPGQQPFWNVYSKRFIYAPAFDISETEGVTLYKYEVTSQENGRTFEFTADKPWKPLSPVWKQVPPGKYELHVFGLDDEGTVMGDTLFVRSFLKSKPFNGPYHKPVYSYKESAIRSLKNLFNQRKVQMWLTEGKPDPEYPLWVHPSKVIGALIYGMGRYSALKPRPDDADMALKAAKTAGDFLLSLRMKKGTPAEYWTPSSWDGVDRGEHPVYMKQIMTHIPAFGARAFLDLYDITGNKKYYDAAVAIADTYVKLQKNSGTWPQLINTETGEAVTNHKLVPTYVIMLFDRLKKQYNVTKYEKARMFAFNFCLRNPMKTFNWQAQYEDTRPKATYKNMSRHEAVEMAALLFKNSKNNPQYLEMADELLRFAEDQFVIWEQDDPVVFALWFKKDSKWCGNTADGRKDWFIPCVMEQYIFYTPICGSTMRVIIAYLEGYKATGRKDYHAKAVSIANSITRAQEYHGGGEYPTHLRKTLPELNWLNNGVFTAVNLLKYADLLERVEYYY